MRPSRFIHPRSASGYGAFAAADSLSPLLEGPVPENRQEDDLKKHHHHHHHGSTWLAMKSGSWMKSGKRRSDHRLLLGVLGCPLAPVAVSAQPLPCFSIKDVSIETSSAQYIVQQYIAATGAAKAHGFVHNSYAAGKVKMITAELQGTPTYTTRVTGKRNSTKSTDDGCFVLWQMMPDMWHMELALEDSKIQAGCDGKLVWRYTPWLGAHAAKGPVRPLRRALQGLDPITTANLFANARCVGEKRIEDEDCFVLKVTADQPTLSSRSDGPAEIIRHVLFGYFSQKTGWLICLEDTHLTRIQSTDSGAVYWDTIIESTLKDYRTVDGIALAHSGRSVVTLFRFGEEAMGHTKTRIEELWNIEEVAFNVPGLSPEFFIPPSDVNQANTKEASNYSPIHDDDKPVASKKPY